MRRKGILALLILLIVALASASALCYDDVLVLDRTPYAHRRMTVTNAAVSRLQAVYRNAAGAVFLTVENNNIRYRIDGGDPSAVNGHLLVAATYQNFWITDRAAIRNLRMIGIGGNAIVIVTYYRRN